jgi:hypothetical protein
VRRLKDGRVQVMISGGARNPKTGHRVIRGKAARYRWGANKDGKSWIVVDSSGNQVSGFFKLKKTADAFRRLHFD